MSTQSSLLFLQLPMKKIVLFLLFLITFSACGDYQKALKSEDVAIKYDMATKLYDEGKYAKAIRLFEQLAPQYRGKPQSEKMFYMYAQSFFKTKDYMISAGRFESFVASYPRSEKAEECAFLEAVSYSKSSPVYSLDQTETNKGIERMQYFIDAYPNSPYLAEANLITKTLREKLEKKSYEIAYEYYKISDHKSALVALENFIVDYPGTQYKEKALFYKLSSAFIVAENSFENKMEGRLNDAKLAYNALVKYNPETAFKSQADDMLVQIEKDLKQFSK